MGEYTAVCFAEGISFADGVRLVKRRGEAMQAASDAVEATASAVDSAAEAVAEGAADAVDAAGEAVEEAVNAVISAGSRTADLVGKDEKALSTKEIQAEIIKKL